MEPGKQIQRDCDLAQAAQPVSCKRDQSLLSGASCLHLHRHLSSKAIGIY